MAYRLYFMKTKLLINMNTQKLKLSLTVAFIVILVFSFNNCKRESHNDSVKYSYPQISNTLKSKIDSASVIFDCLTLKEKLTFNIGDTSKINELYISYKNNVCAFILSDQSIAIFNKNGDKLAHIKSIGKGPEEYFYPNNLSFSQEYIYFLSNHSQFINKYSRNGEFIKRIDIKNIVNQNKKIPATSIYDFYVDNDDNILVLSTNFNSSENYENFYYVDFLENFSKVSFYLSIDNPIKVENIGMPRLAKFGNAFVISFSLYNKLFKFIKDNKFETFLEFKFDNSDLIGKLKNADSPIERIKILNERIINKEMLSIERLSAIDNILVVDLVSDINLVYNFDDKLFYKSDLGPCNYNFENKKKKFLEKINLNDNDFGFEFFEDCLGIVSYAKISENIIDVYILKFE